MALTDPIYDLFKDINSLIFRNGSILINFILQRTLITIFNDHYFEVFILKTFITFQNVRTVEFHHNPGFLLSQSLFYTFQIWALLTFDGS